MPRQRNAAASSGSKTERDGNARERGGQVSHAELMKLAKRGVKSHTEAANELGLPVSSVSMLEWCRVLVEIGEWDEIDATTKAVKRAKDVDRNRWELIAARADVSVAEAKNLYGDEDEVRAAGIRGRGGNGNGDDDNGETKSSRSSRSSSKSSTRSTRAASTATGTRRSRTLAERRAAGRGNPS